MYFYMLFLKKNPKSVLCHWYDLSKIQYDNQYIDKYICIYIFFNFFQFVNFQHL